MDRESGWRDDYTLGHADIDADHRTLFDVLGDLERGYCDRDLIDSQIKRLERYVAVHFAREEALMRQGGYPDIDRHLVQHRDFTATVQAMRAAWNADDTPQLQSQIAARVSDWLRGHILGSDRQYAPWLPKA